MNNDGKNLKRLMAEKDVCAREVAEAIGVSAVRMCSFLDGRRLPNDIELANICRYFGCSARDVMGD